MKNSDFLVFCDVETSGLSFVGNDPTQNLATREQFQAISLGAIITDRSFNKLAEFYTPIIFQETIFTWSIKAQSIHGMSIPWLKANGRSRQQAANDFNNFLLQFVDTSYAIHFVGHNFRGFDAYFIDEMMSAFGYYIRFAGRTFDSNTLCLLTGTDNSTELFQKLGIKREEPHNALSDCKATLEAFQIMTRRVNVQIL